MLHFKEQELNYIKKVVADATVHIDRLDKEELIDYIDSIGGDVFSHIRMFTNHSDVFDKINKEEHINEWAINILWWADGMWVWLEGDSRYAEDVKEFIDDDMYCQLYEKILDYWEEQDEEEILEDEYIKGFNEAIEHMKNTVNDLQGLLER